MHSHTNNLTASQHEAAIREAFDAHKLDLAASRTLEAYGEELMGFLFARLRNPVDAQEVFAMFAADLWTGLSDFGFRCSVRTWVYTLARNAATRYQAAPQRRVANNLSLSQLESISAAIDRHRSATDAYLQTAVKDRFRQLREQLTAEDQMLLILRVDRGMAWRDLALALSGDVTLSEEAITRETARLRKAFERVKQMLKELAAREGLLRPDG
jgi:RNA polymerase sigma-70 factor, ECF subfamily